MVNSEEGSKTENNLQNGPLPKPIVIPYRPRNKWKGEVRFIDGCIEKNHDLNPFLPRLYAQICLNCEEAALKKLNDVKGVPKFISRPTKTSIRMTAVPGVPLGKLKMGDLSELCFNRIKNILAEIHDKGVAHCDLHMRNILVDNDDPYIIDFATSYVRGRLPVMDSQVLERLKKLDLMRLYKVEKKFFGRGTRPEMFTVYNIIKGLKK
jgi:RIO-like serine/threonine protein kinase